MSQIKGFPTKFWRNFRKMLNLEGNSLIFSEIVIFGLF